MFTIFMFFNISIITSVYTMESNKNEIDLSQYIKNGLIIIPNNRRISVFPTFQHQSKFTNLAYNDSTLAALNEDKCFITRFPKPLPSNQQTNHITDPTLLSLLTSGRSYILTLEEYNTQPTVLSFAKETLCIGATNGNIYLENNPGIFENIQSIHAHTASVTGLSYNYHAHKIFSACGHGKIKLWDLATQKYTLHHMLKNDSVKEVVPHPSKSIWAYITNKGFVYLLYEKMGTGIHCLLNLKVKPCSNKHHLIDFGQKGETLFIKTKHGCVIYNITAKKQTSFIPVDEEENWNLSSFAENSFYASKGTKHTPMYINGFGNKNPQGRYESEDFSADIELYDKKTVKMFSVGKETSTNCVAFCI